MSDKTIVDRVKSIIRRKYKEDDNIPSSITNDVRPKIDTMIRRYLETKHLYLSPDDVHLDDMEE